MHGYRTMIENMTSTVRSTMSGRGCRVRLRLALCFTVLILALPVLSKTYNDTIQTTLVSPSVCDSSAAKKSLVCLSARDSSAAKVAVVLSGGGAKGMAHIGVLRVLERAGIPIDIITGTSMGALIGGLYSIGYNAHELDSIVRSQDWMFLFSDQINRTHRSYAAKEKNDAFLLSIPFNNTTDLTKRGGIMKGQSIFNKFSDLTIGYHQLSSFNQLPIPFSCVATDLVTGREVIMDKGSLPLAMRASMSVPGFFEPVREDSMILVDGGILNNFPVNI